MFARYLVFIFLAPLFFIYPDQGEFRDVFGIGLVLFLHNAFVHWVFQTNRHTLFLGSVNAAFYIIEATFVCVVTGAQQSEAFLMFMLVLIGAGVYARKVRSVIVLTAVSCLALLLVFGYGWLWMEQTEMIGVVASKLAGLLLTGWLVCVATAEAQKLEDHSVEQSAELAESESVLRTVLDSTADPILVFDQQEFLISVNEAACHMLKMKRDELIGHRVRAFLFDDGTLPTKFSSMQRHGVYNGEQIIVDSNGEERNTEIYIRRFARANERYFVALIHDVTARKNLQEATRLANVRLERLNRELQHVDELKTGILKTMSQRLLSPISPLLGYVQMLLDEELGEVNPEQRKALQACRRSALRIARIAEQSLAVGTATSLSSVEDRSEPSSTLPEVSVSTPLSGPDRPHDVV